MTHENWSAEIRRRVEEIHRIAAGLYDDAERETLLRMVSHFEQLSLQIGPQPSD